MDISIAADSLEQTLGRGLTKKGSLVVNYLKNNGFRAGITDDIPRRFNEHNVVVGLLQTWIDTSSVSNAIALEKELEDRGYDIGKGQHYGDNSTKVYIYEKRAGVTVE